jgi:hypothetical protein
VNSLPIRLRRARAGLCVGAGVTALAVPVALAAAAGPGWWRFIASEQTPMTWLQSVVLVLTAVGAALLTTVTGDRRWVVLAVGFGALALDERFALHERIRDSVLAPRDVTLSFLPWVGPGDFLILVVGVVGLALLPWVARGFAGDRAATVALVLGTLLAVTAIGADSVDPARWSVTAERWEQTLEECVELAAGLALATAVWLRLLGALASIAVGPAPTVVAGPGTAGSGPAQQVGTDDTGPTIRCAPPDPGRTATGP